uniref:response regulator n=1 Tax=uncultured Caulobacter sp. TaxID=158749 RepID=UPI0025F0F05E|nr:response regulator transcription factor [uncultured Caulobacter sp.]
MLHVRPHPAIALADDHSIVRAGLRELLLKARGWQVVAEADTGQEAIELARRRAPDVLVLDVSMPDMSGIAVARAVRAASPRTEVLMFTMHDNESLVRESLAAGAKGFVLKSASAEHILDALAALLTHRAYFCPGVTEVVLRGYLSPGTHSLNDLLEGAEPLTARETHIIRLLSESRNNRTIASMLDISIKTVESHRTNVMRKLGAHSLADLVRYAVRNGLIDA